MLPRRRTAALAAAFTLAFPATALAQGAGDEQYTDPLAGQGGAGGGGNSGGGGGGGGGGSDSGTSNPGGGQGGAAGTSTSGPQLSNSPPGTGNTAQAGSAIPRTGADPGLEALFGASFILIGAGLRVRVGRPVA